MSDYLYIANIIATNIPVGNALAALVDPDVGGNRTFSEPRKQLRKVADGSTAGCSDPLLEPATYAALSEFMSGGYPQVFLDAGITTEQMDMYRTTFIAELGPREELEGRLFAFAAEQGYERVSSV